MPTLTHNNNIFVYSCHHARRLLQWCDQFPTTLFPLPEFGDFHLHQSTIASNILLPTLPATIHFSSFYHIGPTNPLPPPTCAPRFIYQEAQASTK